MQSKHKMVFLIVIQLLFFAITASSNPIPCSPPELGDRLHFDPAAIESASSNYGNIVHDKPLAVLSPSSIEDIASLIKSSYNCSTNFGIAARGNGHSARGQNMASNGVVINMLQLKGNQKQKGIAVSKSPLFADVGGEQLWMDVLNATVEQGVAPVSWTDYLYLSVGGTLSNAGISGQTFRFGPQISNVYELDVVTGKGETVTCSAKMNSELFYGVLGGLGQFGVITRARIALGPAPKRVKWLRMLYTDFSAYVKDQEYLISNNGRQAIDALDYLEGALLLDNGTPNAWRTNFFPQKDLPRIISLIKQHGIVYCIEVAKHYEDGTEKQIDKELKKLIKGQLSYNRRFIFETDVSYAEFLTRVQIPQSKESHPWLNLFIPKSRILDFDSCVFRGIVLKRNITTGPILFYPMNRNKWDDKMSASIPDEDIFYTAGLLHSSDVDGWQVYDDQNKEIMQFLENAGIKAKQYLPSYNTKEEWIKHFDSKWTTFQERKTLFDPKMILSPGQRIFNQQSLFT